MNKKYFAVVLFFSLLSGACVQRSVGQTYLGIKKGISFSSVNFDDVDPNFDATIIQGQVQGDVLGIILKVMSEKHAGLQFEVNLANKGWVELIDQNFEYETKLRYLNMNAHSHIALGNGKFRLFLLGGPYLNYLLSSEASIIPEDQMESITYIYDINDDNRWEFGLGGGGGFSLDTKFGSFQLEGKANLGLSNVIKRIEDTEARFSRNFNLEFSLSYMYPIFKKEKEDK